MNFFQSLIKSRKLFPLFSVGILLFLIPLGTRVFIGGAIEGFHEYEAFFFYASDILVFIFLIASLFFEGERRIGRIISLAVFLFCAGISVYFSTSIALAIYSLSRLLILAWLSLNIGSLLKKEGMVLMFAVVISISALTQAGVGIVQFSKQGSVGLSRFGETVLISSQGSSSTVRAEGGRFLRAYGTFPHPNVLAGFLAIGLGALGYLYVSCEEKIKEKFGKEWTKRRWKREDVIKAGKIYFFSKYFFYRMLIAGAFFVTTFGLAVTFSRSGWIAGLVVISLLTFLTTMRSFGAGLRFAVLVVACSVCTYLILSPIILPRADISKNEPAVQDRLVYARIGFEIARDNPMGVGVGNQVLYGVSDARYKDHDLRYVWQWEPVHNLYLLIADEIGWIGVLSFISFILVLAFRLLRNRSREAVLAIALLAGILTAGLFDHYLWTLQPGRLMLWVVVGIAISQGSNTSGQDS